MTFMQATTQSGADVVVQAKPKGVTVISTDGSPHVLHIPTSHEEMLALLARRRQISDQLTSVTERRNEIVQKLRSVPDEAKPGLQAQLQVLDTRAVQLETDLGAVGQDTATARARNGSNGDRDRANLGRPAFCHQTPIGSAC